MVAFFAASNPETAASLWLDELSLDYSGIGLEDIKPDAIELYPNPTSDWLNLKTGVTIKEVTVYNMLGQRVYSQFNANPIYIGHLQGGMYLVHIKTHSGINVQKIVVQQH
jgi:hypothetical protein